MYKQLYKSVFILILFLFSTNVQAKIYAFIIGVDNYTWAENLQCAKRDAQLFYETLQTISPTTYVEWNVLLDKDANVDNILSHLLRYVEIVKREDTFIFYYAGHGFKEGLYVSDTWTNSGILPYDILKLGFKYIAAKDKLIFIDACHSAGILNIEITKANEDKFKKSKYASIDRNKGNVILFLGSGVNESSKEIPELGHGLFTFFLCHGLLGGADHNKDKVVQIDELFYYFRNNTVAVSKKMSYDYQCPRLIGNFDKKLIIADLRK